MKEIKEIYQLFTQYPFITTDTRKVLKDSLFFALKGENFDANDFVEDALQKGAAYVITERADLADKAGVIVVDDSLKCLQELAAYHRSQLSIPFIAITGSNGKTTTKELIARILSKKYKVFSTPGNLNNHIGLALSILMIDDAFEIAVIEIGANQIGENRYLTQICQPHTGVCCNIGKDHLGVFGGEQAVIEAYKEFIEVFNRHDERLFILNLDDPNISSIYCGQNNISYSASNTDADFYGEVRGKGLFLTLIVTTKEGERLDISTNLFGDYNIYNVLAAMSVGAAYSVAMQLMKEALESYHPENNRSQVVRWADNTIIFDAYNANPSSMLLVLRDFNKLDVEGKWVIIGDMHELGEYSCKEHLGIIELLKSMHFEQIILVGKRFGEHHHAIDALYFEDVQDLKEWFVKQTLSAKNILIKASRSERLELVFKDLI